MKESTANATPRDVLKKTLDALRRGDLQGMVDMVGDECVWEVMGGDALLPVPGSARRVGKKAIAEELLPVVPKLYHMETLEIRERGIYADGPMVIVEFNAYGKTKAGHINDGASYVWVCKVENGKLTEVREYIDSLKLKGIFTP